MFKHRKRFGALCEHKQVEKSASERLSHETAHFI